jgi:hypothetical protein
MSGSIKEQILSRIQIKKDDYTRYQFTPAQDCILKTFFDLVQEYSSLEEYYQICVLVLKQSMAVESRLYLIDQYGHLQLVQASDLEQSFPQPAPSDIVVSSTVSQRDESCYFPVYFGGLYTEQQSPAGVFQVISSTPLSEQEQFFINFYTRRIGVSLDNKVSACQNIQHIKFVNGLVTDIEHNVIIPNMYFKHLFNKLRSKISGIKDLEQEIRTLQQSMGIAEHESCRMVIDKVVSLQDSFFRYHQEMQKHHTSCSLFLESLFRKDHFENGELVLRTKKCFVEKEIIEPQLEHFAQRFQHQGIVVRRPADMRDEEIALRVDIGLLAQVYANLFSNALKYTAGTEENGGVKVVAYGREYAENCFGDGRNGVKFNVFSTGVHLDPADVKLIFDEGFRGGNAGSQSGEGHGLAFIRQVVEIHGGRVGYEAVAGGNNFYFFLPVQPVEQSG